MRAVLYLGGCFVGLFAVALVMALRGAEKFLAAAGR